MRAVTVTQDKENEIPLEVLASSIVAISDGVKKLRNGRLKERALLLLIQQAAPPKKRGRYSTGQHIPISTIKAVLDGMEALKTQFVK